MKKPLFLNFLTLNMILEQYLGKAVNSGAWLSHFPEKQGEIIIKDYSEQLEEDIKILQDKGIEETTISGYKTRYINLFLSWLNTRSQTSNWFITGPANYNIRRHEKKHRSEQRHYELWQEWRDRAKKAIIRKSLPEKTFLSELDRYTAELAALKANHEKMKEGNKRIAQARKTGEDITEYLIKEFNITPHMIEWTLNFGFNLPNSNANIKRIEERIQLMEKKEENSTTIGTKTDVYSWGKVIINHEADRIQLDFNEKPSEEIRKKLKQNAYKWAPSVQLWQRQLTNNALWNLKHLLNEIQ